MQDRIYLLSVEEFLKSPQGSILMDEALGKVDEKRRERAMRMKQPAAKAACVGAGLLLQYAICMAQKEEAESNVKVAEAIGEGMIESMAIQNSLIKVSTRKLLSEIEVPISLEFSYGKSGKPYLKEYPFYFNLSHSGDYVVCVISEQEIGIDIQEHRDGNMERIAKRFFSSGEIKALEECQDTERTQLFFDMWAGKEAYGKYTGDGITESLEKEIPATVMLQLIHSIPGYSLAICKAI